MKRSILLVLAASEGVRRIACAPKVVNADYLRSGRENAYFKRRSALAVPVLDG
jgi:hypothetical protein